MYLARLSERMPDSHSLDGRGHAYRAVLPRLGHCLVRSNLGSHRANRVNGFLIDVSGSDGVPTVFTSGGKA